MDTLERFTLVWCDTCGKTQPIIFEVMQANEKNDHDAADMLAALGAIRDAADERGRCTATDIRIAELAGVGNGAVREAIKRAHSNGLIAIENTARGKRVIINKHIGTRSCLVVTIKC
jgi:DNA-binding FadR family transcriptional regulator